jgi:hypothetical protein
MKGSFLPKRSLVVQFVMLAILAGCTVHFGDVCLSWPFQRMGCPREAMVAYDGSVLPKNNIASIKSPHIGYWNDSDLVITINCLDGKKVPGGREEFLILPGRHQIQISVITSHVFNSPVFRGNIEFEVLANHEYLANGKVDADRGNFFGVGASYSPLIWVEDTNSKQVIAQVQVAPTDQSFKSIQCQ